MRKLVRLLCLLLLTAPLILSAATESRPEREIITARIQALTPSLADEHPRLLLRPADVPAFREFVQKKLATLDGGAALAKLTLPELDRPLPPQPKAVANGTQEGSAAWREGYTIANDAGNMAWRQALAWQLTGDERYAREAARWLLHLASWNIDRDVLRTNDELFIQHLRPMIFAYDWAWSALKPEERTTVRAALEARLKLLAEHIQPKFSLNSPTPPDNSLSHPMRFISTLGLGGLALYHETGSAPEWLAWSYEYYNRQFPVWGGDAGGWAEGLNYWATGMTQHLRFLEAMKLLGFDEPLARPFFRNTAWFAAYFQQPYQASSFGDLTNVMAPSASMGMMVEKFALLNQEPYLLTLGHKLSGKYPTAFSYYEFGAIDSILHLFRRAQSQLAEADPALLPQSRYFNDIGWVAMHSRIGDKAGDIMLGFKSSPFGSASHSFADQNSFVINAFGEPLAISSGYREWYDSPHHKGWTRTTAAKNAVLVEGEGQAIKQANAIGKITRFINGDRFSFASGDATAAYDGRLKQALRHVLFVDRRYFVTLDELAATEASRFQWLLHARESMSLNAATNSLQVRKGEALLDVQLFAPVKLGLAQTDQFSVPVASGYEKRMPNEWHARFETQERARDMQFLALLYPHRDGYSAEAAQISAIKVSRGQAIAVQSKISNDRILFASEGERRVRSSGGDIDGLAGYISRRGEETQLALIDGRMLHTEEFTFDSDTPLSLEVSAAPFEFRLSLRSSQAARISFKLPYAPRTVSGVPRNDWDYDDLQELIKIKISSQTTQIRVTTIRPNETKLLN